MTLTPQEARAKANNHQGIEYFQEELDRKIVDSMPFESSREFVVFDYAHLGPADIEYIKDAYSKAGWTIDLEKTNDPPLYSEVRYLVTIEPRE